MDQGEGLQLIRASGLVLVMNTPKGRGIFASRDIPANTIIEVCPVLVLDKKENDDHISRTELYHYTYNWPCQVLARNDGVMVGDILPIKTQAVILGLGSLFNHSTLHQNVGWTRDAKNSLITYTALRKIVRGEELCISYGDRLTFIDADAGNLHDETEEDKDLLNAIQII